MKTSDHINELAAALAKAQGEMKNAHLNKVNPHFKSKFADLAAVRDAVVPVLAKHGIATAQATGMREGGFCVVTRLIHSSGQWIEGEYPIVLDPAKPQVMGSAMSYARRYGLSAMGVIAAEEDDDGNNASKTNGRSEISAVTESAGNMSSMPLGWRTRKGRDARDVDNKMRDALFTYTDVGELAEFIKGTAAERKTQPKSWQWEFVFDAISRGFAIADSPAALHAFRKEFYTEDVAKHISETGQEELEAQFDAALAKFESPLKQQLKDSLEKPF